MSAHVCLEAPRQQVQPPLCVCKTVSCSNGWVVVWRREECGRSGNKKRDRETMMPLQERRHCSGLGGAGHEEARRDSGNGRRGREMTAMLHERRHGLRLGDVGHVEERGDTSGLELSGPWPSEPGLGREVCPPGQHFLAREVEVRCTRFGCVCDRTHRCRRCLWWRCADDACFGVAWEDWCGARLGGADCDVFRV